MKELRLLRGRIIERYKTVHALAQALKLQDSTLSYKLNGKTEFTVAEALQIAPLLGIHNKDIPKFFCIESSEIRTDAEEQL